MSLSKSADDVGLLMEDILLWAQSQLNKIEYRPTELKLSEIIRNSIKGLKQMADDKQVDIRVELNDQITVLADPNMVQTIVRNIFSNAVKFTPRGGSVKIRTTVNDQNNAVIIISDSGIGIDKDSLPQLFDISNTLRRSGTENEKSTGLGLILVKDFVDKNKGTISVESEKGKGTTVSFTLPTTQQ